MSPRLCIDIDNCLAASDEVMREVIRDVTGVSFEYTDIQEFDYHGPLCTDRNGNGIDKSDWDRIHERFSEPEVISRIRPFPGAVKALNQLQQWFEIHFVTTRLPKARAATASWLHSLSLDNASCHSLHFVDHRKKHVVIQDVHAAVEDDPVQAELFAAMQIRSVLLAHPWNANAGPHVIRVNSWTEVVATLSP